MKLSQAGKMAVSAVRSNKLRSFLTMLGIIIGVMAVTLLISLVQGATSTVTDQLSDLGGDKLTVSITDMHKKMTLSEVDALVDEATIAYVSPTMSGNTVARAVGNATDVSIMGITAAYDAVQELELATGRVITQMDNDYRLDVCVMGQGVAKDLYGNTDILGQTIRISGKDYRIVGVLEEQEQTLMGDANATVYIPLTNAQRLLSNVNVTSFYVVGYERKGCC